MAVAYVPAVREILSIVNSDGNATVTTSSNHYFVPYQSVRFLIPSEFGMIELDGQEALVLQVTSNTILVKINITEYTPFSVPVKYYTPAQVIPIGDFNFGFTALGQEDNPLTISGAFRIINT